ncbi:MAG: endonuclease MutS2, partial [Campylobacteraceae bacterium]|nr:endonuclease MutS2 [Campylobacteraceae bacterium]
MRELFTRLDLDGYVDSFEAHLAREKPIALEGDTKRHFEMIEALKEYEYPAPPKVANLDTPLMHLSKQGILHLSEIWEFIKIIHYFKRLIRHPFEGRAAEWLEQIIIPENLKDILEWLNEKGELKPNIDQRLERIHQLLENLKSQVQTQFRQLLSTKRLEPYLADRQIHLLHSQEALLVRGGFNHVLKGRVIGRSPGGFFYVVPEPIDSLKKKESSLWDEKEEITYEYAKKISAEFTKALPFLKFINKNFDRIDAYHARLAYAKEKGWEFLLPSSGESVVLEGFKHPALQDAKPLHVNFKESVLLVTGVNAGGKTMLLKSLLSAVLMAKYLLPIPLIAAKSKIGQFKHIEAIIEDPQNVKNDISTFAGRMVQFSRLFHKKGSILVGVDEIELGTDADEAASLFKVLIEHWIERGIKLIITTHHKRLASLLATNPKVELLAALYDEKNRKPTFEFMHGTIGKSYAFETAQRYGIPASLIAKAKVVYGEDKENLNELIQKNIDLDLRMKHTLARLEDEENKAARKLINLQEKESFLEKDYRLKEAKLEKEYQAAINAAKEALRLAKTKEGHRALNEANAAKKLVKRHKPPMQEKNILEVGDAIKYGRTKGVLKSLKKDKAIIECEGITLHVPLHTIKKSGISPRVASSKTKIEVERPSMASVNLDLHGLRAEEALEKLDGFLSDALISGFDE